MSDLISRQKAIDAFLTELTKRERKNLLHTWSTVEVKYFVVDMLEKLPSAQPEIIRCKDCEYGEQDEVGRWFCRSLGCQIGNEDGSGYCADAERRTDD